jgi:hypothetical protein
VRFDLPGIAPGSYVARWYDTYTGRTVREDAVTCAPGQTLWLSAPDVARDLAVQLFAPDDPPEAPPAPEPIAAAPSTPALQPGQIRVVAAEGSPNSSPDYGAPLLTDGEPGSYWETRWDTRTIQPEAWFAVDLGSVRPVGRVRWLISDNKWAPDFDIQFSTDKAAWTTFEGGAKLAAGAYGWHELTQSVSARYIRFVFRNEARKGKIGGFAEVEVYE